MKKLTLLIFIMLIFFNTTYAKQKTDNSNKDKIEYVNLNFWENFKDEYLTEHLLNLYEKNYDLKIAELKVKENEKLVKMNFANELPFVGFEPYIGRDFKSSLQKFGSMYIPSYSQSNFLLPIQASYEIDIWGKNRLKTKSYQKNLEIIKQKEKATYILLVSDFVSDYFNLIKTDKLLDIQKNLIETQSEILSKIKDKKEIGLATVDEVLTEEKYLSLLNEEKNSLENKKEILLNSIRAYLTVNEGEIKRKNYNNILIPENIPEKLKADIIENRPDYMISELSLKKSGLDVRVARKELLPSIVIFGEIGLNAYKFNDLFKSSSELFNAGIFPSFDIFAGGKKVAFLKYRKYLYDEAFNNYQKTTVDDIKEVNNALFEFRTQKKNFIEAKKRNNIQNEIFNLIKDREIIGTSSKLDVLYGREASLLSQKEEASNKINCIISIISLYKSTGGADLLNLGGEDNL